MQIHYAGKVSKEEFLKALFIHSDKQFRVHKWFLGIVFAMVAFSVLYLAISIGVEAVSQYASPALLIPLAAMTFPWWTPYLQLSAYDQKGSLYRNNLFGQIDETGVTINSAEVKVSFPWKTVGKYELSKDILLLYQGKYCFNIFTRSMFSSQSDWEGFISLIKAQLSANQGSA